MVTNPCDIVIIVVVFFFDEKNLALRSRDRIYRLGDRIRVTLEEADRIKGKLRFSLLEDYDE